MHAGAGFGKTTLLSQVARGVENTVWLSLDGENAAIAFVDTLSEAVRRHFPEFDFSASGYRPFSEKSNFVSVVTGAFIYSLERTLDNSIKKRIRSIKPFGDNGWAFFARAERKFLNFYGGVHGFAHGRCCKIKAGTS